MIAACHIPPRAVHTLLTQMPTPSHTSPANNRQELRQPLRFFVAQRLHHHGLLRHRLCDRQGSNDAFEFEPHQRPRLAAVHRHGVGYMRLLHRPLQRPRRQLPVSVGIGVDSVESSARIWTHHCRACSMHPARAAWVLSNSGSHSAVNLQCRGLHSDKLAFQACYVMRDTFLPSALVPPNQPTLTRFQTAV